MRRRCDDSHEHQPLTDGRTKHAARYLEALCKAICRGIVKLKRERERGIRVVAEIPGDLRSLHARVNGRNIDPEEFHETNECHPFEIYPLARLTRAKPGRDISGALAWDDLTGMRLKADQVIEARETEMGYIKQKGVWTKIPRAVAHAKGWKIVKTRWIDINKGDDSNPVYRGGLVGKEFNNEAMDGIFAGTPPLEALRCLIHEAATIRNKDDPYSKVVIINDVARVCFEAPAVRQVCVELPDEDITSSDKVADRVGHLQMSLYGTRDAAMNRQE